ncbi:hypothetical protein [Nonomuraea basaltis]|uniref:hypothetical protein n=1 Tax=Nonomuraea basaltis TaxID=2495887 RepID=UPI00110C5172|nr:hypothetical protein [Nonomuraea basaltis]TMR90541.1 hypothetical protein EJK15_54850 [Nonomuraea basaltis]
MTYTKLSGPAVFTLEIVSLHDKGEGITLDWISSNLWTIGDSGHLVTSDTLATLSHAGFINVGELAEGSGETVTITQAGRDYLTHHHNARRDNQQ